MSVWLLSDLSLFNLSGTEPTDQLASEGGGEHEEKNEFDEGERAGEEVMSLTVKATKT